MVYQIQDLKYANFMKINTINTHINFFLITLVEHILEEKYII